MTTTVNYPFGGGVLSPATGVVLNNEMGDFSVPTEISADSLPPAPTNFIRPNKRPLSSMIPVIVVKGYQLAGAIGGCGGMYIIPAVIEVFLNHFVLGMEPLDALQSPRVYRKVSNLLGKHPHVMEGFTTFFGRENIGECQLFHNLLFYPSSTNLPFLDGFLAGGIRNVKRIHFGWAVEREDTNKKQKKGDTTTTSFKDTSSPPFSWQSMIDNLRSAHQELTIIIDLINTVEKNDYHLGKYFKQSAKALEKQVAKEARFYVALISENPNYLSFLDNFRFICFFEKSTIGVEHDNNGMLALNLPDGHEVGVIHICMSIEAFLFKDDGFEDLETSLTSISCLQDDEGGRLSSISFFDVDKYETATSRWARARTRDAKVGKGLSQNSKARKLRPSPFQINPRHRYGHLRIYPVKHGHLDWTTRWKIIGGITRGMLYRETKRWRHGEYKVSEDEVVVSFHLVLRIPVLLTLYLNCDILMNDVEGAWEKSMSRKVFVKMLSPTEIAFMGHLADFNHSVKFKEAAKDGNLIPLYRSIFSDHRTPVLAYRCLVKEDDRDAPIFFVIGAQPTMEIVAKENMVTVMDHHEGRKTEEFVEDPMVMNHSAREIISGSHDHLYTGTTYKSGRAAVQMKNALYVTGGFDGKSYSSLDPREKKWSKIADMNKRKGCHSIVVSNEKAQIIAVIGASLFLRLNSGVRLNQPVMLKSLNCLAD
ncbi:hypothetical protein L2E82_22542 [Cichorium intybus]|uniref:Uncharacterized protein n=1 Tax=Cichorium intybus TaxID=13427 RepID=A0ACB9DY18_CICIN|nr:hypothetical protein L2E82_22542 [Cichorium intybus]